MAGILDFLATALPRSIFANMKNYAALQRGMTDAQEGMWGAPKAGEAGQVQVTPQVGTLPGEQGPVMGARNRGIREPMYAANESTLRPGLLDAVPQQQRPFIEGLAKAMGPDVAAKAAYESNVTKPMTAYESANLQQQGERPVFAGEGQTGYAKGPDGTYKPVIQGAPKPPQSRQITRGLETVTQQLNPATNQFEDLATAPRQLPVQPQAPMSQERLSQERELITDRQKAQEADEASQESEAQAIANYQQAPLTNFAMAKPQGQRLMARVMQVNPDYRAQNFRMSSDAQTKFAGGTTGNLVRSFNVGISHLNTLGDLTDALGNSDVQALNKVNNAFKTQFGSEAPTNFNAAKAIVGDEIIKAIVGSGGALADRENAQNQINAANTPAQLKGVIATYKKLMAGQLKGLKQQYETSTFLKNFDEKLSPETIAELESIRSEAATPAGAPANDPISRARDAISKGANRAAVIKRLRDAGIDPGNI